MNTTKKLMFIWLIVMFIITFTCSLTYLVTQQVLRLDANERPAQLATDTEIKLQNGRSPISIISGDTIDISKSLDTFVMIFDKNHQLVASSGMMNGNQPSYPRGVLDNTAKKGEVRVTWQPKKGLRFASVALKTNNGYIVAARSLYETENLIDKIGNLVLLAWGAFLLLSTGAILIINAFVKRIL